MKKYLRLSIGLLVFVLILVACSTTTKVNGGGSSTSDTSYPSPKNLNVTVVPVEGGYPYPSDNITPDVTSGFITAPLVVPTPSSGKVVFYGQMLTPGPGGTPYQGNIYLGYLVEATQSNYPPMIKFSEDLNPKAVVDTEGNFYFADVDPGKYALVIYSLGGTYIVSDESGGTSYVTGEPGSTIDLGIISVP